LLVGGTSTGSEPAMTLQRLGYACVELNDPYTAMATLAAQPLGYSALVLSLSNLFGDELKMISAVKHRFPHVEVWLTRYEGRQGAVDEAMRLGADGFLDADGLHRPNAPAAPETAAVQPQVTDTVLSAEELSALLDDPPQDKAHG
jgi:DNA-binding NarL/FixJ family response regulator